MNLNMKRILNMTLAAFGVLTVAAALTPNASAGCGDVAWNAGVVNAQSLSAASTTSAPRGVTMFALGVDDPQPAGASIVGMWSFTFVANGTVLDAGFSQWHSDGTEITNSSRPPATGNFCMGVWKRIGPSTYTLNHKALNFDNNGNLIGPATIREEVTVSRDGNSYSGTFTIDLYDNAGHTLAHVAGDVTGERITAD